MVLLTGWDLFVPTLIPRKEAGRLNQPFKAKSVLQISCVCYLAVVIRAAAFRTGGEGVPCTQCTPGGGGGGKANGLSSFIATVL